MSYNLGLVSISFRNHSPEEILDAMKNAGLTHIEWGSDVHCVPEKAQEIASLTKKYGIVCSSYGTYFRIGTTPTEEISRYIAAAKTLDTDILRLWCGNKNSEDYTQSEKEALFCECKRLEKIARDNGVILCMECHNKTYTNKKESALELMKEINSPHFQMYWQPNQFKSEKENLEYASMISQYTHVIHVFNWEGEKKYPLCDAVALWKKYLEKFDGSTPLLLEFMPDGKIESLKTEADALKEIVK